MSKAIGVLLIVLSIISLWLFIEFATHNYNLILFLSDAIGSVFSVLFLILGLAILIIGIYICLQE